MNLYDLQVIFFEHMGEKNFKKIEIQFFIFFKTEGKMYVKKVCTIYKYQIKKI